MKKISFYTFGCRLNQSETASIQHSFEGGNYQVVGMDEPSDIVVVNTCTVTEGGDADTRHLVHKVNRLNPGARIALVGCQAQIQKEQLALLPNVRWVVGNARKMDLASVFDEHPQPEECQVLTPTIERKPFSLGFTSVERNHTRANIKVQDGCDFFCSFCEIPYARGRARSRVFDDIFIEARALVAAGHKELILTGINIGTYSNQDKSLMDVIKRLETLDGLERIRISSIEPTTIDQDLFDYMAQGHKLCRYLHIPLQSGHNDILQEMKRKYSVEEFSEFVRHAKVLVPDMCIGTDVIVGFPGETDAHFEGTVEVLKELPIDYFHVFSYSPRHMAHSRLSATLSASVINQRSQILRELSNNKRRNFHESLLGSRQTILFEHPKDDGEQNGLTDHFVRVKVKESRDLFNQILSVRLISIEGQSVLGELVV